MYFDSACREYEGAQAKIVVYYPRKELKSCEIALYLIESEIQQSSVSSSEHKQFRGFLVRIDLEDFLLETFASKLHCVFCVIFYRILVKQICK
jgi:hypothetical protein